MIYGTVSLNSDNVLLMCVKMFESSTPEEKVVEVSRSLLLMVDSVVLTVTPEHVFTFDMEKNDVFREIAEKFNLYWVGYNILQPQLLSLNCEKNKRM